MPVEPRGFRKQVHDQALEAAERMLIAQGWDRLRFGEVATAIGVSRPTLYAVFGGKQGLAEALVLRETDRFLTGIGEVLDHHPADAWAAVVAATEFTFAEAERSPVLHAVLTSSRSGADDLLPLLTTRSGPLLQAATAALAAWFVEHFPEPSREDVDDGVDAIVRLVVSHLVLPAADPQETPGRLAKIATRYLAMSSSGVDADSR